MPEALIDNDVVEKLARWGCIEHISAGLFVEIGSVGYLQSLSFVVGKRLRAVASNANYVKFEKFLESAAPIEPTGAEIELAASIEGISIESGLGLDVGESLLFAVAVRRGLNRIATGDKRAICSGPALSRRIHEIEALRGCLVSLEQVLARLLLHLGQVTLRQHVCSDEDADTSARICFACSKSKVSEEDIFEALASYQADLAKKSQCYSANQLYG